MLEIRNCGPIATQNADLVSLKSEKVGVVLSTE